MASKISLIIIFTLLLFFIVLGVTDATPNVYVVPVINDTKILPCSSISSSFLSKEISIMASPDEYTSASFVINSDQPINNLRVSCTNLSGTSSFILSNAVNIRAVKCWYQGSYGIGYRPTGRYLTPELLLHDDSLVKVNNDNWTKYDNSNPKGKNYLKVNGNYTDVSDTTPKNPFRYTIPIKNRLIIDSTILKPLNLPANYNKQFWITLHIPNNAIPGKYIGNISVDSGSKNLKRINLNLQVLPIALPSPDMDYCIYYRGKLTTVGTISSENKNPEQYTAEMKNMLQHGVVTPTTMQYNNTTLQTELSIRQQVGMENSKLFRWVPRGEVVNYSYISNVKSNTVSYGVKDLYIYGPDETNLNNSTYRTRITNEHKADAKHFNAQMASDAEQVADILDIAVVSSIDPNLAKEYHNYGNKVYLYGDPQICPELPETFRLKYGLALWQADYDGAMNYVYQSSEGDIYNDFDASERDYVFAYPTANGVIDTVQWEGFREGVNDVRYIRALENAIAKAKENGNTVIATEAENYLNQLKNSNLYNQDLDIIRSQIVNYILAFSTSSHYLLIDQGKGSGFYSPNTQVSITANAPQKDMIFDKWVGDTKYVTDINAASTKVTAIDHAISLTATYKLSDPIGSWYDTDYKNRKIINLNHSQVSNTDQKDFPVFINLKNNELKTFADGGKVQSGYDIIFALPDKTLLSNEIVYYNNKTGELKVWVKIPTLSASTNTTICMYYNNSLINYSQENITDVWSNHFVGVWHLGETGIGAVGNYKDSTSYSSNSINTVNQPAKTSLWYGGAQSFDGSSQYIDFGNGTQFDLTSSMTISFLMNKTNTKDPYLIAKNIGSFGDIAYGLQWIDETKRIAFWSNGTGYTSKSNMVVCNTTHYFVFTYDGKSINMYTNGQLGSSSTYTNPIPTNTGHLVIAKRNDSTPSFGGTMGEVRISNVARSPDWVQTEYNNMYSPSIFSAIDESIDSDPHTIFMQQRLWELIQILIDLLRATHNSIDS